MKKSDIYQFYFLGVGRHLSTMVGSDLIAYDREKHRYLIPEGLAFSDVIRVGIDRISSELKHELKLPAKSISGYEWLFKLMTDVGANSYLGRLLLTGFSPYINSPLAIYYLSLCITKYEVCDAGSMIFNSQKVRFNNVAKMLNSLVDHSLSPDVLAVLSQLFTANYLVDLIPPKQKIVKSEKGELLWFGETDKTLIDGFNSDFLSSVSFRPWAVELVVEIGTDMDRNTFMVHGHNLVHESLLKCSGDGRFDYWGVGVIPMAVQYFLLSAEKDLSALFDPVPVVIAGRGKEVDFSPIMEAEDAFWNRAKGVFGILD